jgi:hypothetical protein
MSTIAVLCYIKILFSFGPIIDFQKKLKTAISIKQDIYRNY